jgi:hypothetical protein
MYAGLEGIRNTVPELGLKHQPNTTAEHIAHGLILRQGAT